MNNLITLIGTAIITIVFYLLDAFLTVLGLVVAVSIFQAITELYKRATSQLRR